MTSVADERAESVKLLEINQQQLRQHVDGVVRDTVEETLNALLDAEADELCGAQKYERSPERTDYRAGHDNRQFHPKAGEVQLRVPKLRRARFERQVIERYKRRESSVEEALGIPRFLFKALAKSIPNPLPLFPLLQKPSQSCFTSGQQYHACRRPSSTVPATDWSRRNRK